MLSLLFNHALVVCDRRTDDGRSSVKETPLHFKDSGLVIEGQLLQADER